MREYCRTVQYLCSPGSVSVTLRGKTRKIAAQRQEYFGDCISLRCEDSCSETSSREPERSLTTNHGTRVEFYEATGTKEVLKHKQEMDLVGSLAMPTKVVWAL